MTVNVPKKVIVAATRTANDLRKRAKTETPELREMFEADAKQYDRVARKLERGRRSAARRVYDRMNPAARDEARDEVVAFLEY